MAGSTNKPLALINTGEVIGLLMHEKKGSSHRLYFSWSYDGFDFIQGKEKVTLKRKRTAERLADCFNFRITSYPRHFALTYFRKEKNNTINLVIAYSKDLLSWEVKEELDSLDSRYAMLFGKMKDSEHEALYRDGLFMNVSNNKKDPRTLLFTSRPNHFDDDVLSLIGLEKTKSGTLLIYDASFRDKNHICLQAGAVFINDERGRVIWRSDVPIAQTIIKVKKEDDTYEPLGVFVIDNDFFIYWNVGGEIVVISFPSPFKDTVYDIHHHVPLLKKSLKNPIIEPHPLHEWESEAVFNPAAIYENGKVHLLYRALGPHGISVLGYASSKNGHDIDERWPNPVYSPRQVFEGGDATARDNDAPLSSSGGGWAGIEDPKLTVIGKTVYLAYVAFSGWDSIRIAIASISKADFLSHKWDKWSSPRLMSRPNKWISDKEWNEWGRTSPETRPDQRFDNIDKSACLLPEKVKGKYVIFHRVYPDILIDFVDDLKFGKNRWLKNQYRIKARADMWDSRKLSIGAPPIKTEKGWLTIYHAVDDRDPGKYKIGAMLLDLKDPTKVTHRTNAPILVPDQRYENEGKPGIAYPCGAVVIDDTLHVYYGGGDRVVCVATAPLKEVLDHLMKDEAYELKPVQ